MKKVLFISGLLLSAGILFAQEQTNPIKFGGSVQLRSELDGRDFKNASAPNTFTTMRTRLSAEKGLGAFGKVFLELQDTRTFGATSGSTISNDKNIDAHQAFILIPLTEENLTLQAGRFEMIYGTERFFGGVGWSQIGRSFDGFRFRYSDGWTLDAFALNLKEVQSVGAPFLHKRDTGTDIYGAWFIQKIENQQLDLFGYYENSRPVISPKLYRSTLGATHTLKTDALTTVFEGAYQMGSYHMTKIGAWMFSGSAMVPNLFGDKSSLTAGADLLSGQDPKSKKITLFDVSYGTNHKFYGYMDYLYAGFIPTGGLQDFYLKLKAETELWNLTAACDLHHFNSFEKNALDHSIIGQEIDLTLSRPLIPGVKTTWGTSVFLPGDVMKDTYGSKNEDIAFWSYLQINVTF